MNIWVVSTFWLLWIMLLWIFMYKLLCGCIFSFLWGIYLEIELLGHMVTLTFWVLDCFSKAAQFTYSHQQCIRIPISPYACQYLLLSDFSIMVILVDIKWYLTVALICISLMANDVEYLFVRLLAIWTLLIFECFHFSHILPNINYSNTKYSIPPKWGDTQKIFKSLYIYVCVCVYIYIYICIYIYIYIVE